MSWSNVEFHLEDGSVFYGQYFDTAGVLLPYLCANKEDSDNFERSRKGMELPARCDCLGESCQAVLPLTKMAWWGTACRKHMLFQGPLDPSEDEVEWLA